MFALLLLLHLFSFEWTLPYNLHGGLGIKYKATKPLNASHLSICSCFPYILNVSQLRIYSSCCLSACLMRLDLTVFCYDSSIFASKTNFDNKYKPVLKINTTQRT